MQQLAIDMVQNLCYIWGVLFTIIGVVVLIDEFCFSEEID